MNGISSWPMAVFEAFSSLLGTEHTGQGTHRVGGQQIDLGRISCPVLTIATWSRGMGARSRF